MRSTAVLVLVAGLLVHAQSSAAQEPLGSVQAEGISFDYQDADLRYVLAALAAAAGVNLVYTSLPERPVTLRTNRPFTPDEIVPLLRSLVESSGFQLIEEGPVLRIIAAPDRTTLPGAASQAPIRIFVYRLKHARADRVAGTLQALLGAGGSVTPGNRGLSRAGLSQELMTQRLQPADPAAVQRPAQPGEPDLPTAGMRALPGVLEGALQIVPDELTNSLLVRVSEGDWEVVRQTIDVLDLRPLQVLIEVMIAEVRRTSAFGLG
ncbi:MAG: secretin N-terminal domain-containing protein, partial [Longimicrobiales bacterium]